jgi:serine/threonine protein phosphatase 1
MSRFVIGDIHGCISELRYLLDDLPLHRGDVVVFLGDYIDRGPDSKEVVSFLIELKKRLSDIELVFLKGNHEDMFLGYLGLAGQHGNMFLVNGGIATLASYGLTPDKLTVSNTLAAISPDHLQFYNELRSMHLMDAFLCVHAGVRPEKSLAEQSAEDLIWIRDKFIFNAHKLPYTVLFGHTPQHAVLFDLPYKIGLDTGLVYGNMLTCLEVDEKVLFQISRGKKSVKRTSVQSNWKCNSASI